MATFNTSYRAFRVVDAVVLLAWTKDLLEKSPKDEHAIQLYKESVSHLQDVVHQLITQA